MWIAPGAHEYCEARGEGLVEDCTVTTIARRLKDDNVTILNILVGDIFSNAVQQRMSGLSSCDSEVLNYTGCPYLIASDNFTALAAAAEAVASRVASGVGTTASREASDNSRTICTGSGVSFAFLLMGLPLLAYLFFKPAANAFENAFFPREKEPARPAAPSIVQMENNPAYGIEIDANDADPEDYRANRPRPRREVSKVLHKASHKKKKKKRFSSGAGQLPAHARPTGDSAVDAAATKRRSSHLDYSVQAEPRRRGSSVIGNVKAAIAAPVAAVTHDTPTEWSSGLAAVYDGDDWQEKVADFVLGLVFCRACCRGRPDEGRGLDRPGAAVGKDVL